MSQVEPATIAAWNAAHARIALTPERERELTIELDQLAAAIAAARPRLVFDTDPHDFRAALIETAAKP